jgi:hypothetical protein
VVVRADRDVHQRMGKLSRIARSRRARPTSGARRGGSHSRRRHPAPDRPAPPIRRDSRRADRR